MARPSPAATRITDLLDFLAQHPGESFRLSELARQLKFNKATAHGMLTTLANAGYLVYDQDIKTFSTGPAIVSIGLAAVQHESKLAVFTLGVLQTLSETVQAPCYANVLAGDETVVIASAGARDGQAAMAARRRLVPPAGVVFMAWAAERRVNAWLDRIGAEDRERTRYRRVLATVRERGFSVTGDEGVRIRLEQAIAELGSASNGAVDVDYLATVMHDLTYKDYQLDHIDAGKPYSVWSLAVPVFDIYGSARMSFVITGLGTMTGAELMSAAGTAVASAAQATKLIAGLATPEEARSDAARRHELEPEYHTSA